MMTTDMAAPAPRPAPKRRLPRLALRFLIFLLIAVAVETTLTRTASKLNETRAPSGFARGMLHGALMPLALPNLLVGRDVTIYAENNTGRTYKLGYTAGVNGCGLLFFGIFFWRLARWRKAVRKPAAERARKQD